MQTTAHPRARVDLGLELGGTKVVAVLATPEGVVLEQSRRERWTTGDPARDLEGLLAQARALLAARGLADASLRAIGVSAPGPLDAARGVVLAPPNLPGWRDVPIVDALGRALGAPARLENDANAAALAEARAGAGQGARSLVYMTMSTGIGAGVIVDGALVRGAHSQAGELGHVPVVEDGRRCACGLRGCLEAYTGGAAIAEQLREAVAAGRETAALELAGGEPRAISARHWCAAIRRGDPVSLELRAAFIRHLARGLAFVLATVDPDIILLGTIVREHPDLFLEAIRARVRELTLPELHATPIVPAALGPRLPVEAALAVAALVEPRRA